MYRILKHHSVYQIAAFQKLLIGCFIVLSDIKKLLFIKRYYCSITRQPKHPTPLTPPPPLPANHHIGNSPRCCKSIPKNTKPQTPKNIHSRWLSKLYWFSDIKVRAAYTTQNELVFTHYYLYNCYWINDKCNSW